MGKKVIGYQGLQDIRFENIWPGHTGERVCRTLYRTDLKIVLTVCAEYIGRSKVNMDRAALQSIRLRCSLRGVAAAAASSRN
jgi:hypothetical protein